MPSSLFLVHTISGVPVAFEKLPHGIFSGSLVFVLYRGLCHPGNEGVFDPVVVVVVAGVVNLSLFRHFARRF